MICISLRRINLPNAALLSGKGTKSVGKKREEMRSVTGPSYHGSRFVHTPRSILIVQTLESVIRYRSKCIMISTSHPSKVDASIYD